MIFPGGTVRALAVVLQDYFACLQQYGTTAAFRGRMLDFQGINELLGTEELLKLGKRYDAEGIES